MLISTLNSIDHCSVTAVDLCSSHTRKEIRNGNAVYTKNAYFSYCSAKNYRYKKINFFNVLNLTFRALFFIEGALSISKKTNNSDQ